jgi:hypothetical protein
MVQGEAVSYEVFADGWLQDEESTGRPVDLLVLGDGSLLISDDQNGIIYRISYSRPLDDGVASLPETRDAEQAAVESASEQASMARQVATQTL